MPETQNQIVQYMYRNFASRQGVEILNCYPTTTFNDLQAKTNKISKHIRTYMYRNFECIKIMHARRPSVTYRRVLEVLRTCVSPNAPRRSRSTLTMRQLSPGPGLGPLPLFSHNTTSLPVASTLATPESTHTPPTDTHLAATPPFPPATPRRTSMHCTYHRKPWLLALLPPAACPGPTPTRHKQLFPSLAVPPNPPPTFPVKPAALARHHCAPCPPRQFDEPSG